MKLLSIYINRAEVLYTFKGIKYSREFMSLDAKEKKKDRKVDGEGVSMLEHNLNNLFQHRTASQTPHDVIDVLFLCFLVLFLC